MRLGINKFHAVKGGIIALKCTILVHFGGPSMEFGGAMVCTLESRI